MIDFRALREQLADETIKNILAQFNVEPVDEDENKIIFPTCCHNLEGGSPKLWYYKDSKLFHCFTECQSTFDIFTLLQKMYQLRGKEISLRQAISLCDLDASEISEEDQSYNCRNDLRYMQELSSTYIPDVEHLELRIYDKDILRHYAFDYVGLMPWIQEGISVEALQQFNIKYDSYNQAILIPNFDYNGNLIGIRARYLKEEDVAKGKYRPLYAFGTLYNHPTGRTFYGIYENHKNIERKHMCVIYEGKR